MQIIIFILLWIIAIMVNYILKLNKIKEGKDNKKNQGYEKQQDIESMVDTNIRYIFVQAMDLNDNYNNNKRKRRKLQYIKKLAEESIKLIDEIEYIKIEA